jgi:hypothetical protein
MDVVNLIGCFSDSSHDSGGLKRRMRSFSKSRSPSRAAQRARLRQACARQGGACGVEPLESRVQLSTTYYVSTAGNDASAGAGDALAFRTLQKAANVVSAGDTVVVRAGTYVGMNLYGKAGGTQAAPIRFLADPGVIVTHVSSTGVNAGLADINVENAGGWYVIQGFRVSSDGSAQRARIRVTGSSNTQVLNNAVDHAFIGTVGAAPTPPALPLLLLLQR